MFRQQRPIIIVWSDWDNTMIASAAKFRQIFNKTAEELQKEGFKLLIPISDITARNHDAILQELFGTENFSKIKSVFQKNYDEVFAPDLLHEMQIFPGVKEMIRKLPEAEVYLGIISNHYVKKPGKHDGIQDHLHRNKIDTSKVMMIGLDTLENQIPGFSPKLHAKPNTTAGELALKLWGIDPKAQVIKSLMFGDAKTDMEFAKNMDKLLKSANPHSSCTGVLFNTKMNGDPIFSQAEIANILKTEESKDSYSDRVAMGYGKLFTKVRNLLTPFHITDEMLQESSKKLLKP